MRELTQEEVLQVAGAGFDEGYFSLSELGSNTATAAAIGAAIGYVAGGPPTAAMTGGGAAAATFYSMATFNIVMSISAAYGYLTQC